jgi:hypothetical protein
MSAVGSPKVVLGGVLVKLTCAAGAGACQAKVDLAAAQVKIAKTLTIQPAKTETVKLETSLAEQQLLGFSKTVKSTLSVVQKLDGHSIAILTKTVKLKIPSHT